MKSEIAPSWHPGITPIAVFEDGREVFDMRREADPLISMKEWLDNRRRIREGVYDACNSER